MADLHVVAEMNSAHEKIIVAHARRAVFLRRAMNRHVFANPVPRTDLHPRRSALEGIILRLRANHRAVTDLILRTQNRVRTKHRVGANLAALADHASGFNNCVGPDRHVGTQFRRRIDDRGGMNPRTHKSPSSLKLKKFCSLPARGAPRITWSSTSISRSAPASRMRLVTRKSASEGCGFPDG